MSHGLGDTAVIWAWGVAKIAYNTCAGSPRTEKMRADLIKTTFDVLKTHYDKNMVYDEFLEAVKSETAILQQKDKAYREKERLPDYPEQNHTKTFEQLFESSVLRK